MGDGNDANKRRGKTQRGTGGKKSAHGSLTARDPEEHPARGAYRVETVDGRHQKTGAGGAKGVADGQRAAPVVELAHVNRADLVGLCGGVENRDEASFWGGWDTAWPTDRPPARFSHLALAAHVLLAERVRVEGVEVGKDLAGKGLVKLKDVHVLAKERKGRPVSGVEKEAPPETLYPPRPFPCPAHLEEHASAVQDLGRGVGRAEEELLLGVLGDKGRLAEVGQRLVAKLLGLGLGHQQTRAGAWGKGGGYK